MEGEVDRNGETFEVSFVGEFSLTTTPAPQHATIMKVFVSKITGKPVKLYAIMNFKEMSPKKILESVINDKTKSVPFFKHLMNSSALFANQKKAFGLTISYSEVYFYEDHSVSSQVLDAVLQSNIPEGVTVLFPVESKSSSSSSSKQKRNQNNKSENSMKLNLAFIINRPVFDLLIDENSRMPVNEILPILSREFTSSTSSETTSGHEEKLPIFLRNLKDAYTTHVSFDASLSQFYVFIRLKVAMELVPNLMRIKVTNVVLHKNIKELGTTAGDWKMSAKGSYNIGDAKFEVQYTQLNEEDDDKTINTDKGEFGLTGHAPTLTLSDVIEEFNPYFYPNNESRLMIDNTEIETLKLHDVKLFSRIQANNGTPHILVTGLTNIPQWEKNIQIAMTVLRVRSHWEVKWVMSFKHSPLTNIIEALTGFEIDEIPFLHNSHIMTTLLSSPMENMETLPPRVITTPLLRLPVKKGLNVISLLKFPDNCGDDKMCEAATQLLATDKVYTAKGSLSTKGFELKADIMDTLDLSGTLKGVNNTLKFTIGNTSRMDIMTSVKLPETGLLFEGPIHIYKTGDISMQLSSSKRWLEPLGMRAISIKDLKFVSKYGVDENLKKLDLTGSVDLGLQGNGAEIEAPLHFTYNIKKPVSSTFYANFSTVTLRDLLKAFTISVKLPEVLETSSFPTGLMLTYSRKHKITSKFQLHGDLDIFGRSLYCALTLSHLGVIKIETENSPAPIIYASGLIIVQESRKSKLRGPKIVSRISHKDATVTMKGYVKLLGIESDTEIELRDNGISFEVEGKLMEHQDTKLKAVSKNTPDKFQVTCN